MPRISEVAESSAESAQQATTASEELKAYATQRRTLVSRFRI
ncbi:hypothetical protein [Acidihalobacter aeolianus]|nr:hypothetical protein [Acidihalobacter aeolianus]